MELIRGEVPFEGRWKFRWHLAFWLPSYASATLYLLAQVLEPLNNPDVFFPCLLLFPSIAAGLSLVVIAMAPIKMATKTWTGIGSVLGAFIQSPVAFISIFYIEVLTKGYT